MRKAHKRALGVIAGVAALGLLAGCSTAADTTAATPEGPISIDVWGWDAEVTQQVVNAYNASQSDVKVNYVLQASNAATQTNFRNVMQSKQDIPCWVPGFGPVTTAVVNGWAQDITQYVTPIEDKFNAGALAAGQVDGKYYGYPTGADATFMLANEKAFTDAGLTIPTTWDEMIEDGKILKQKGTTVINLAGEDPSTLIQLSQLAGASWFSIDGDTWKVNFTDEESLKAADVIQQIVDNGLASNQTYQDKASLYSYFDSGQLATIPLAWWSMTGYQTNFTSSLGNWKAVDFPQFDTGGDFRTAGIATPGIVPVGCENPAAAVDFETWVYTTPEGIAASKNAKTGAVNFPTGIKEVSQYTAAIVPDSLLVSSQSKEQVGEVIAKAQESSIGVFDQGPDYDAWFPELQDQWGKAMDKQITVAEALKNVQDFVAADLDSKGINYTIVQ